MDPLLKAKLQKQRYHIVGEHGGVKVCHWTKESLLRDRQCYKGKFYGVASHNCMQMSPVVDQCNLACTYCWREPHMDTLKLTEQDPLEMLYDSELGNPPILNIELKPDTHGSLEAIIGSIKNIENEEVKINIVHESVGSINANDVNLAMTTGAFVMGFNVRADNAAKSLSEKESIEILYYSIIYDLIDGIKTSVEGHLAPEVKEEILGTV